MKDKAVIIVGGGVIGLCCAYYLNREGHRVTVIDKGEITRGTSFGNAGFVSPSHFVPLASPYIIGKALRWMLNSSSPFYIQPKLDKELFRWCMAFWRSSGKQTMRRNTPPLNEILQLSRNLMTAMRDDLGNYFRMEEKGCFSLYKTGISEKREQQFAVEAQQLGIEAHIFNRPEVQYLEPYLEVDVLGGVLYPGDCHLHPGDFMETLKTRLIACGVTLQLNTRVTGIYTKAGQARAVIADQGVFDCEELVLAAGSWLPELTRMLDLDLLLQPGKGYSLTYPDMKKNLCHPVILSERKVALTPMGKDLRMGGTMELSGINDRVLTGRVRAIYEASKAYFPGLKAGQPEMKQVWTGLRPLSPDGLPYIGRLSAYQNITIAGGHAMLGLSLAAATGKLVEEMTSGKKTAVGLAPFNPERFSRR